MSRDVTLLPPQWLPTGGNTAVDSFSRLNLELCLFWGLFVCHDPYFVGPLSTNNTKGCFLLWGQAVSRYVSFLLPQGIPTGGYTAADFLSRHNMAQWMFMFDRKVFRSILDHFRKETNQVDPVLGGCCRRHGPCKVGPSSATTLKRVL